VAAGVTTVRVTMGSPERLAERERLRNEPSLPWPNLVITSPLLAGEEVPWPHEIVADPAEAARLVRAHADAGYDAIKVYDGLSRPVYDAIVEAARAEGIRFVGHVPAAVGISRAIEAGQATIEHAEQLLYAAFGRDEVMTQPLERVGEIVDVFRGAANPPCVTPTLRVMTLAMRRGTAFADSVDAGLDWSLVDPQFAEWWRSYRTPAPPEAQERRSRFLALQERLVAELHEAGVPLLAGTDTPHPYLIPGRSLLDEIDALADAGLSRFEALAAATRNPGRCLAGDPRPGIVAEGGRADLLLLAEDPRTAPATLREPLGVLVRGTWFDREALGAMERSVREAYAANPGSGE
jgi:imidazolonepropionase-like amidohydrolase